MSTLDYGVYGGSFCIVEVYQNIFKRFKKSKSVTVEK